jgi:hypothetical protein
MNAQPRSSTAQLLPPIIMTLVGIGFLYWSYTYDPEARLFPVIIGWTWIILSALDIVASSGTRFGDLVAAFFTGQVVAPKDDEHIEQSGKKTIISIVWVIAFIGAVYFVGFFPVIPFYIFLFVVVQGKKSIKLGAIAGVATVTFSWLVFAVIFSYPIFKGVLFEELY